MIIARKHNSKGSLDRLQYVAVPPTHMSTIRLYTPTYLFIYINEIYIYNNNT